MYIKKTSDTRQFPIEYSEHIQTKTDTFDTLSLNVGILSTFYILSLNVSILCWTSTLLLLSSIYYSQFPSFGFGPVLDYFACFTDAFLQKRDKWNETYMLWKSNHWGIKTCKNYCSWCRIGPIDNDLRRPVSFTLLVPPCFGLQRKRYVNALHKKGDCKH